MATWTVTPYFQTVFGNERVVYATLLASGTYTSGGDAIQASAFGLDKIDFADCNAVLTSSGGTTGFLGVIPDALPATSIHLQLLGGASGSGAALAEASGTITSYVATIEVRGV